MNVLHNWQPLESRNAYNEEKRTSTDESGLLFVVRLGELTDFGYKTREKYMQDWLLNYCTRCKYLQRTAMLTI